jgi:uncharacterized protein
MTMSPKNPFPIARYVGPAWFCNRTEETRELTNNIQNGRNTVLLSPRRIGKSVLIQHVFYSLKQKKWQCIYVDIAHTATMHAFTSALGSSVLNALPYKKSLWNQFMDFLKGFRPGISANPVTGELKAELYSSSANEERQTVQAILDWLDKHTNVVVALDEFQTILRYPEEGTEAWLRGQIQMMKNTQFIFAGSHQHLLSTMFHAPKRPFYASASQMKLSKIDAVEYAAFIRKKFGEGKRKITDDALAYLLDWTHLHTYYVQAICNKIFELGDKEITVHSVYRACDLAIREKRDSFYVMRDLLTAYQFNVLTGVAKAAPLYSPTGAEFVQKHHLRSGASVLKGLHYLLDADLVFSDYDSDGKLFYSMSDIFFMRWIQETI